jgi:hypothetical protein
MSDPTDQIQSRMIDLMERHGVREEVLRFIDWIGATPSDPFVSDLVSKVCFMEATGRTFFGGVDPLLAWLRIRGSGRVRRASKADGSRPLDALGIRCRSAPDPMSTNESRSKAFLYLDLLWSERMGA